MNKSRVCLGMMGLALALSVPLAALAEERLQVEVNKGKRVSLSRPAASVVAANPAIADVQVVSPRVLYVYGKSVGETSLFAIDAEDNTIYDAQVSVSHNIASLNETVRRLAPDSEVKFTSVNNGIVMDGFASSSEESENIRSVAAGMLGANQQIVNMVTTAGSDQVMLKVKIVEMARNDLKNLGVRLQNVFSRGNFAMQVLQGGALGFDDDNILLRGNSYTNVYARYKDLSGAIDALEGQGLATVLAEPSLATTSGKAASFLAGGQFPIPAVGENGTITIQYQPFGVSLNFTPVVLSKDRMSITVAPEVSTLDFNNPIRVSGITYPILNTRRASAVVELGSGDSFMLAGLLKNEISDSINKLPGIGDVPVLGALFRSTQFQNNQTELVILVTPYLVKASTEAGKLQTPKDGYVPPSDLRRLLFGTMYQQEPMAGEEAAEPPSAPQANAPGLHGKGGFMLE